MKEIIIVVTIFAFSSCSSEKLDMTSATKTAENAIQLISDKKFDDLSNLYTKDFKESESKEIRETKLKAIVDVTGKLVDYNLFDSVRVINTGEESKIVLKYKVKHSNITTTEIYSIIKEDGKYLLADINITNK